MDSLRGLLMLLGVPFHASFVYAGWPWYSNPGINPVIEGFAAFTHTFRMPTFFVIAGVFAVWGLTRRSPNRWWRNRVTRLGVPFVSCVVLLGPLQLLAVAMADPADGSTMTRWAESMSVPANWIFHLWFLPVLLCYCAVLLLVSGTRLGAGSSAFLARWIDRGFTGTLWGVGILSAVGGVTVLCWAVTVVVDLTSLTFGIVPVRLLVVYAPCFVLGVFLGRRPSRYRQFAHASPTVAVSAVGAAVLLVSIAPSASPVAEIVEHFLIPVTGIVAAATLFTAARRFMDYRSVALRRLADMSMTVYLFHNVCLLWGAVALMRIDAPPVVEFFVLVVGATAASVLCYLILALIPRAALVLTGRSIERERSQPGPPGR